MNAYGGVVTARANTTMLKSSEGKRSYHKHVYGGSQNLENSQSKQDLLTSVKPAKNSLELGNSLLVKIINPSDKQKEEAKVVRSVKLDIYTNSFINQANATTY